MVEGQGVLTQEEQGCWARYRLMFAPDSVHKSGSSVHKDSSSVHKGLNSAHRRSNRVYLGSFLSVVL